MVWGRMRTMLRRVEEPRTKNWGRPSFSDSALRHSRRRWSRACWSGVRASAGSEVMGRWRWKVSAGWDVSGEGMGDDPREETEVAEWCTSEAFFEGVCRGFGSSTGSPLQMAQIMDPN